MLTDKDLKFNRSDAKQRVFLYVTMLCGCSSFSFFGSLIRFLNDVVQIIGSGFCDLLVAGDLNLFVQNLALAIIISTIGLGYCAWNAFLSCSKLL